VRVLFDTNVVLDHLLVRESYISASSASSSDYEDAIAAKRTGLSRQYHVNLYSSSESNF
jgi:hypothetical protein